MPLLRAMRWVMPTLALLASLMDLGCKAPRATPVPTSVSLPPEPKSLPPPRQQERIPVPLPPPPKTSAPPPPRPEPSHAEHQAEAAWWLLRAKAAPCLGSAEAPLPWDPGAPKPGLVAERIVGSQAARELRRAEAQLKTTRGAARRSLALRVAHLRLQLGDTGGSRDQARELLSESGLSSGQLRDTFLLLVEVHLQRAEFGLARGFLDTAASTSRNALDRAELAWAEAKLDLEQGRYREALACLGRGQKEAAKDRSTRARLLRGQLLVLEGRLRADLGETAVAERLLAQGLKELPAEARGQRLGAEALAALLRALRGGGSQSLRQLATAAHAQGLPLLEASLLNSLGCIQAGSAKPAPAALPLQTAFDLTWALDLPDPAARIAVNLAAVELAAGQPGAAVGRLLWVRGQARQPLTRAAAEHGLMMGWAALGSMDQAILAGKAAVTSLQRLRGTAGLLGPADAAFRAANAETFRALADLLIQDSGRLAEAQEVLALLKDDEFGRLLDRDAPKAAGTGAPRTGEELALERQAEPAQGVWLRLAEELEGLRRTPLSKQKEPELSRRIALEGELRTARQAYQAAFGSLRSEARAAGVEEVERLSVREVGRLSGLQGHLGKDTVLISYILGPSRIHILLTTARLQLHREAPVGATALAQAVQGYRWALTDRSRDPRPEAQLLYKLLLEPVRGDLEAVGARRILLDLDGPLRYLPFATLHDGQDWLVGRYAFAVMARGAFAAAGQEGPPGTRALAFGVSEAHAPFPALLAVPGEVQGVLAGIRSAGLQGESFLDGTFTADRLTGLQKNVSVVHIASHFQFRPGTLESSGLLVGDGSLLSLKGLLDEGVRFDGVRLLSLSACQTAMGGGRDEQGLEVEGLGALALDLGAQSVVATLWKVADASTADLMQAFYGDWKGDLTRADALRQAQLRLLRRESTAADWSHPFYWGPFILLGSWR